MSKLTIKLSHGLYTVKISNRFMGWLFHRLYQLDISDDPEQMEREEEMLNDS